MRKEKKLSFYRQYLADLADMQLISKSNTGSGFLLGVIDIYSKYVWVIPLKDKIVITMTVFQKFLNE